jgi:hypothetical protein
MRTRGFRYETQARMFLRFDRFLQRHRELDNKPVTVMLQRWAATRSTAYHVADCERLGRALAKARRHLDPSVPLPRPDPRPQQQVARQWRRLHHGGNPLRDRSCVSIPARATTPAYSLYNAGAWLLRWVASGRDRTPGPWRRRSASRHNHHSGDEVLQIQDSALGRQRRGSTA